MLVNFFINFRDGFEEVGNQAKIGHLKDGSFGVLIDGNNRFGVLHACQMLNSTADTYGNVQFLVGQKGVTYK